MSTFAKKRMLSAEEKEFVNWWAANRLKERRWVQQLAIGLPLGLAFGFPILLSVMFRGWYQRMPYVSGTQLTVILIAVLLIVVFYAVFRMKFKWEANEQRYNELKKRTEQQAAAGQEQPS